MIQLKPRYAVAVRYSGEEKAVLLKDTIGHLKELVCTSYDEQRFSLPPTDCVYLVRLTEAEVVESNHGVLESVTDDEH